MALDPPYNSKFPFPSNIFTRKDSSSPTGRRVDLKGKLFSDAVEARVPGGLTTADVYNGKTGFCAAAPVLFELDGKPDKNTVSGNVIVFNRDTGVRIPVWAKVFGYSRYKRWEGREADIIEAYPRSRFAWGATHVAVMTSDVRRTDGTEYTPAPLVQRLMSGEATEQEKAVFGPVLDFIKFQGIAPEKVLSFTEFTVIDEGSQTAPLYAMMDQVAAESHPVRNIKVDYTPIGLVYATVSGEVRLSDFRDAATGRVTLEPGQTSRDFWTPFILRIPFDALYGSVPVVIYGHGVMINKESADLDVVQTNALWGYATIFIDQPYHGVRAVQEGYEVHTMTSPETMFRLGHMLTQSSLDSISLMTALRTSLADLKVAGIKKVINTNRIYYLGTSLGGLIGTTFAATARDLRGAYLQVTGNGYVHNITHCFFWTQNGEIMDFIERLTGFRPDNYVSFDLLVPEECTGAEAALAVHMSITETAGADAVNFVHNARKTVYGRAPRPIASQYGLGDQLVINETTWAMAELLDMPQVGHTAKNIEFLRRSDRFENGYGIIQAPALDGFTAHMSFLQPQIFWYRQQWLKERNEWDGR